MALIAAGLAVAAFVGWTFLGGPDAPRFVTAPVERGSIVRTVSATGTLDALVTVEVGSQLSGLIEEIFVDFNSLVEEGQVVARIEASTFEARVEQATAELASAEANVAVSRAALDDARAQLWQARNELERKVPLRQAGVISANELDIALSGFRSAEARVRSAEAQLSAAEAQALQREASLNNANVDLQRSEIRSPVTGIVIERNISVGQTVAASFQAPVLFKIAQDLSEMQLEANIDEADIGLVAEGQLAVFTVDAFPDRTFSGDVVQVRRAPEEVQNVVSYKVIISASNEDGRLLPGMTANVELIVAERENVLLIPTAALRYRPPPRAGQRGAVANNSSTLPISRDGPVQRRIRVLEDGELVERTITTGLSDGARVEVTSGDLGIGENVVTGNVRAGLQFGPGGGPGGPGGPFQD